MRTFLMLVFALALFIPFLVVGYIIHAYRKFIDKENISTTEYTDNISYQIDVAGCAMIYGIRGHTLSALAFHKQHWWFEYLINILFWDRHHCIKQFEKEFLT